MNSHCFSWAQLWGCAQKSAGSWDTPTSAGCPHCPRLPLIIGVTCSFREKNSQHSPSSSILTKLLRMTRSPQILVRRRRVFPLLGRTPRTMRTLGTPARPLCSRKWAVCSSASYPFPGHLCWVQWNGSVQLPGTPKGTFASQDRGLPTRGGGLGSQYAFSKSRQQLWAPTWNSL